MQCRHVEPRRRCRRSRGATRSASASSRTRYDQPKYAGWAAGRLAATSRLMLNLGLRYDLSINAWANDVGCRAVLHARTVRTTRTISSRGRIRVPGRLTDGDSRRVGLYFADALTVDAFWPYVQHAVVENPVQQRRTGGLCRQSAQWAAAADTTRRRRTCSAIPRRRRRTLPRGRRGTSPAQRPVCCSTSQEMPGPDQYMQQARNLQVSFGLQRQFGSSMAVEADYVHTKGTHEKDTLDNINLSYNPATGANYPTRTAASAAAYPQYGIMSMIPHNTRSKGDSLITAFTKRMSNRWQASATYTLSYFWDAENQPFSGLNIVPFKVQPDLGNDFTFASSDQRHRAVFSGIWEVAHGFQVSGLHYFGAGIRSGYELRRRPARYRCHGAGPPPPEWDDCSAKRLHSAQAEQDRHSLSAAHPAARPGLGRSDRGCLQSLQQRELHAGDAGERRQLQPALDGPVPGCPDRVPTYLLTHNGERTSLKFEG